MAKINQVHNKFFYTIFSNAENVRAFLPLVLPLVILESMDLANLEIDKEHYVDQRFKDSFCDLAVKTNIKSKSGKPLEVDLYFLFEHKSFRDQGIFIQLLCYMYLMWQKDIDDKKPLRVIIPIVFYHGKEEWDIPLNFKDKFDVGDEVKEFLMDYRYMLFDTNDWNFKEERNAGLRDNVFLLTGMALMKSAFNEDYESIAEIFSFWYEKGFVNESSKMEFCMHYVSATKGISMDNLEKILTESHLDGGTIMQTLADRLREEGRQEGSRESLLKTARELIKRGMDSDNISQITGLPKEKIEKMAGEEVKGWAGEGRIEAAITFVSGDVEPGDMVSGAGAFITGLDGISIELDDIASKWGFTSSDARASITKLGSYVIALGKIKGDLHDSVIELGTFTAGLGKIAGKMGNLVIKLRPHFFDDGEILIEIGDIVTEIDGFLTKV